jgi:signal transduction histidine kinase
MKWDLRQFPHRILLISAIVALTAAATLVGYLEQSSDELERRQNGVIMQQICERTATVIVDRIRHLLDIAVLETIEGIGHRQIGTDDLPRVALAFTKGLHRHPYVDRFFLWSANQSPRSVDQVVFYSPTAEPAAVARIIAPDGLEMGSLVAEPELGREILRLARAVSGPRTFLVVDRTVNGTPYQLIVHLLWRDDQRRELFSIIGYTVNLRNINAGMLHRLLDDEVKPILNPDPYSPHLAITLLNEAGEVAYGDPVMSSVPAATASVDMLFFPGGPLTPWLAGRVSPHAWRVIVSAPGLPSGRRLFGGWVLAAVVTLILIAALCGVAMDRQARNLSQMQADFVANVSHQLKTPLSLLSTAIQTLSMGRVPAERSQQYLDILSSQTTRMTALVERILHFSRLEAGSEAYRMEPIDLVSLVRTVVDRFTVDSRQQVPIAFETASSTLTIHADAAAMEQVVVNLLENAVKYGDDLNRVSVRVEGSDRQAAITVRDQGFGINSADLPYVFDKFYRGRAGGRGRPGFGLGLAVVKSVARAHGGRATVATERVGGGSEFTVVIPVNSASGDHGVPDSSH